MIAAVRAALAEIRLGERVERCACRVERPTFLAVGKAAPTMLGRFEGLVIAPDGVGAGLHAGHPIPDRRSVEAAEACLRFAQAGTGPLVVLLSGGASALLCAPARGVTLADKRAVTKAMLRSGASIREINVVRKHLSLIKGGGLARAAGARRVVTLVASDVIRGRATDIGSGPTVRDPSTREEARALLRRFAPAFAKLPLVETSAGGRARVLASPEELARIVARRIGARCLPASQASVASLARAYAREAVRLPAGGAVVRAAEPSLVVTGKGRGGRSTHLAALVLRDLPPDVRFLAMATDGVDGPSGTGGAHVRAGLASQGEVDDAIARFDTGSLFLRLGAAIPAAPTSHNYADIHILYRVGVRGRR